MIHPLRTLIIDDEPIAIEKLKNYVERTPSLSLAAMCCSGFDAIEYLNENRVDLIITDINMPDLNGLDMAKTLPGCPLIIFTTAHPQYAVDSYKVSAIDYLLKPYGYVEFSNAVNKAVEAYRLRQSHDSGSSRAGGAAHDSLFIKVDHRYIRVSQSDIRFIKGYGEYLQVYIAGRATPLLTLSSFASIKECLADNFLQIHRSYIVNMNHVEQIERNRLVMDAETYLPVGDSYKAAFQAYLAAHSAGGT